jgi:hypothetical protein
MKSKGLIFISLSVVVTMAVISMLSKTYGRWEYLSWNHIKELKDAYEAPLNWKARADLLPPKFMKVIEYSDQNAKLLVAENGGQQLMFYFKKNESQWVVERRAWCSTSSTSCAKCHFPWYGGDLISC